MIKHLLVSDQSLKEILMTEADHASEMLGYAVLYPTTHVYSQSVFFP
jgi:hypothetical protein